MLGWLSSDANRLNNSLAEAHALLERPEAARRAIVGLLLVHSALLAYSDYVHSPTLNEPGHLVAGLSYWKFGRFDVYNVNPPLTRIVAALPVTAVGYNENWSGFFAEAGARPELSMGEDFVAANGERSFFLFMIARWACIPFSWLGGIVCYLWARDLFGRPSGVAACAIWCFEPNILAHASLICSDAAGTALGLAACYTFWRWLKKPTWSQATLTGVVLGLAELTKTTLILFYPLWPLIWLVFRWSDRQSMRSRDWFREAGMLAARMLIGLYVLNLGYGFEGSLKPLGEFQFVSNMFSGKESRVETPPQPTGKERVEVSAGGVLQNRFANSWLGILPAPFPEQYLIGIDLQQSDFENYSRPSYLSGKWSDRGWWYFYLYAAVIKVPLGLWGLGGYLLLVRIAKGKAERRACLRDVFVLLTPPIVLLCVVSSKTGFSEHFRYALPVFPFLFVWVSGSILRTRLQPAEKKLDASISHGLMRLSVVRTIVSESLIASPYFLLIWLGTSSLWIYPHSLSYFNETVCGPRGGSRHLVSSNVDWGQDLIYLYSSEYFLPNQTYVYYFGPCSPEAYGLRCNRRVMPDSSAAVVAVSESLVRGYKWPLKSLCHRVGRDVYSNISSSKQTRVAISYSISVISN